MAALCPYTGSETTSGVGLAAEGVSPAPIRYGVDSGGGELAGLMRTFWAETEGMLRAAELMRAAVGASNAPPPLFLARCPCCEQYAAVQGR